MPQVPPVYRPTSNTSLQRETTGVSVPPVYRPSAGIHRLASPRAVAQPLLAPCWPATGRRADTGPRARLLRPEHAARSQRISSWRVVQRALLERDLVGIPLTSSGTAVSIGQTLSDWTLSIIGDNADVWTHSSGDWKASYYRISGDYHVKGFRAARRDYEIGTFSGVGRATGGATHAAERDRVYASFQSQVIDSVPGYRR